MHPNCAAIAMIISLAAAAILAAKDKIQYAFSHFLFGVSGYADMTARNAAAAAAVRNKAFFRIRRGVLRSIGFSLYPQGE
jgi:hypothetical protein